MSSGMKPSIWGFSSAGRALAWHARGHRFDPGNLHQNKKHYTGMCSAFFVKAKRVRASFTRESAVHGLQEGHRDYNSPVISTRKKSTAQECAVLFCCVCPAMQLLNSCWTFAESYGIILSAIAGIVHRLVYQPSKLRRWVRFPLPAPKDLNLERSGSFLFVLHWAVILQAGGGNAKIEP